MEGEEFVKRFYADEGRSGAEVALELVEQHPEGADDVDFNVWIIHFDATTLRFEHDFYPHQGSMPLDDFVAGLRAELPPRGA